VDLTAQDDNFLEAKRRKSHISNNTSQTAKKATKPVPTSAANKLLPKSVLTCDFFAPLRISVMYTETNEAENALTEQEAPRISGRPPAIMMIYITNLVRLQSDLKDHVKGEEGFRNK
jgi:hypothetical protein